MVNMKKIQIHEYNVSEESREETDVANPKPGNEDRYGLHSDKQAIVTDITIISQVDNGSDHTMVMSVSMMK